MTVPAKLRGLRVESTNFDEQIHQSNELSIECISSFRIEVEWMLYFGVGSSPRVLVGSMPSVFPHSFELVSGKLRRTVEAETIFQYQPEELHIS
jgi:hypothetical protein